jgi:hypothetical protein
LADTNPMLPLAKRGLPFVLVGLLSAWLASTSSGMGDWDTDTYPAVQALASGQIGTYLEATPMMGPFATLLQAPFVAISGATDLSAYQWASFPCLLAAGLLGLYLALLAGRRGASRLTQVVLATVCLVNPLTFEALESGHPEEVLTAALAVGAIASAAEDRRLQAAVLLGLAMASKQWAVIAVLPVLMALPGGRLRASLVAGAVAVVLILPGFVAAPDAFFNVHEKAADTGRVVTPWSVWYPAASSVTETYEVDGRRLVADLEEAPPLAGSLSHPLIVLLAFALPVALALRRGRLGISGSEAMALLALLALLRCVLDPVDNLYYHEPLLLALVGWDAFSIRGAPLRSLVGVAVALIFWQAWHDLSDPAAFNAVYLAFAGGLAVALASSVFGRFSWTGVPRIKLFAGLTPNSGD